MARLLTSLVQRLFKRTLAPPKGMSMTAVFQVIKLARLQGDERGHGSLTFASLMYGLQQASDARRCKQLGKVSAACSWHS